MITTIFKGYMLTYLLIIIHSIAIVFYYASEIDAEMWNFTGIENNYWNVGAMTILSPMEKIIYFRTVTSAICVTLKYAVDVKNRM